MEYCECCGEPIYPWSQTYEVNPDGDYWELVCRRCYFECYGFIDFGDDDYDDDYFYEDDEDGDVFW